MKAPIETIYVNPDIFQGESGTSTIINMPTNSHIVYGDNPDLTTTSSGQTILNTSNIDTEITPIKTNTGVKSSTLTPKPTSTIKESETPTPITTQTSTSLIDKSGLESGAKSNKMKYLLYGSGALVLGFVAYKLFKK